MEWKEIGVDAPGREQEGEEQGLQGGEGGVGRDEERGCGAGREDGAPEVVEEVGHVCEVGGIDGGVVVGGDIVCGVVCWVAVVFVSRASVWVC